MLGEAMQVHLHCMYIAMQVHLHCMYIAMQKKKKKKIYPPNPPTRGVTPTAPGWVVSVVASLLLLKVCRGAGFSAA